MPLVTAVATTSHRLREPPPLLAATSLLPSATPPPSPPPASSADVAAANCRNHPSPPLPTAVTSCRKSTAVADHHSRPPSRSGREARIWGGTAVIAAEHRAVAAQGPMPLSSRRAGLKPRLSRGSRCQRCAHTAAGLFLPRLHTRLHTVVGMLAGRRLDGGDPASHAGEDRSGLGGAGSSEEVARFGLSSIFFFLISSHLEFANRIQKQQVRREERKKNRAFSLSLPLSLSSSNLRREAEVVVVVVGAAGEMGP